MLQTSIVHALEWAAKARPDHPAIVDEDGILSYSALFEQVHSVSAWLQNIGLERRARVGIHLPKSREEVIATLAIAGTRGVFVNLNYQWTLDQLFYVAGDCDIQVLITDRRRARRLADNELAARFRQILVVGEPSRPSMTAWAGVPSRQVQLVEPLTADLATLLYTSGSTGRPKGVMITHGQLLRGAQLVSSYLGMTPDERVLSVPPFSFDYGLNQLTSVILNGATLYLQRVPMASEIARSVARWNVTGLPLVAPSWVSLVRYLEDEKIVLENIRYITNTGGSISSSALEALPRLFPKADIYLMYGLTEAFRSTYLPPSMFHSKRGAIGRAIPNVEIFVVDPEKGLCDVGKVGELIHRGDLISLGYWERPEDTNAVIKVNEHLRPILGEEKVLHSGDLVRYDEDGILWFVGRADGMIKTSGHRVSPTEIELVASQVAGVTAAVAFGVPDEELGQVIYLVLETDDKALSIDGVDSVLRDRLPYYMLPRRVIVHQTPFGRTSSGKVDRKLVIEQARGAAD